jgi:hypothetical protein
MLTFASHAIHFEKWIAVQERHLPEHAARGGYYAVLQSSVNFNGSQVKQGFNG